MLPLRVIIGSSIIDSVYQKMQLRVQEGWESV